MDNKITIRGRVCHVGGVEHIGATGFVKRTFVLKNDDEMARFNTIVAFTLKGESCGLIDPSYKGQVVEVAGYIESRSWEDAYGNTKFFTDIIASRIARVGSPNPGEEYNPPEVKPLMTAPSPAPRPTVATPPPPKPTADDDLENLPF